MRCKTERWRNEYGSAWPDTGPFFVQPHSRACTPPRSPSASARLIHRSGFPPIRLHDLRRCAATITSTPASTSKSSPNKLGHSTIASTRDTLQSVTKRLDHEAAGAVVDRPIAPRWGGARCLHFAALGPFPAGRMNQRR